MTTSSEVDICNLALTKIGHDSITALSENSKAGRLCNLHYGSLRDTILREHTWNFAVTRVNLALSTTTPEYEFSYQHALPTDLLRVLSTDLPTDAIWKIEGRFLLSDSDTVRLLYIKQVTDTTQFDQLFIETLSARIAAELALPLSDSTTLLEAMTQLYERKLRAARFVDATEGVPEEIAADKWLNSRVSYSSWAS